MALNVYRVCHVAVKTGKWLWMHVSCRWFRRTFVKTAVRLRRQIPVIQTTRDKQEDAFSQLCNPNKEKTPSFINYLNEVFSASRAWDQMNLQPVLPFHEISPSFNKCKSEPILDFKCRLDEIVRKKMTLIIKYKMQIRVLA